MKRLLLFVIASFSSLLVCAQEANKEDIMQLNGRIYVVVAVVVTILIGLFLYVWSLDRKIRKMEKE